MKARVCQSIWNRRFYAELLGGEFANCYGQGRTREEAITSLKLVIRIRRKLRDRPVS